MQLLHVIRLVLRLAGGTLCSELTPIRSPRPHRTMRERGTVRHLVARRSFSHLDLLFSLFGGESCRYLQSFHKKPSTQPRSTVPPICSLFRVEVAENQ